MRAQSVASVWMLQRELHCLAAGCVHHQSTGAAPRGCHRLLSCLPMPPTPPAATQRYQIANRLPTRLRYGLTGTPFQNDYAGARGRAGSKRAAKWSLLG